MEAEKTFRQLAQERLEWMQLLLRETEEDESCSHEFETDLWSKEEAALLAYLKATPFDD